ncbi:thiol reductant ABC exporter subunit CydD [Pseudonocardia sp. H11422]|uniref:thiol reductant ABC exporter subunit CydD n=1 Tax=Pseudonocardia sp. H11422 TaxID=2835866 RepID=UPI001BDD4123|nr:thiol reductant ABC exporter subunit CydD [Pseudonocardia sp. H11422]
MPTTDDAGLRPMDPRLLGHARAARAYLALCVVLGLVAAGLLIAQAGLLAATITAAFLGGADLAALRTPLLLLAAVVLARAGLDWAQEVAAHRSAAVVTAQLRSRLLAHAVRLGPGWLTGERSAELTALATRGLDGLDGYFARYLPQLVLAVLVPVAILLCVLGADLIAAVTIAVTLPLIPVFMVLIGLATRHRAQRQWRTLAVLAGHFLDVVTGLPTLKVFGWARAQADAIREVTDRHARATMSTLRVVFLSALVLELVSTLSVALVAVGLGLRLVAGAVDLETALLVLILAPEAYRPLRQVGVHHHACVEGLAAAGRVVAVLETPPLRAPASGAHAIAVPDMRVHPVRVEGVTVEYPGRVRPALVDVSLELRPGETVALVGPTGCGKSTLAALLAGFLTPAQGRVAVGGVDLAGVDPDAWRRRLAYLPQQPRLLAGTIADNVRLADPGAGEAAVRRALSAAGLRGGPGPDTPLGERGSGLSAGQRQRVALARTLLRDVPLLVLDEPTAGLDIATERAVVEGLRPHCAHRTVLLVTHRPAPLALADRVVRLDDRSVPAPEAVPA